MKRFVTLVLLLTLFSVLAEAQNAKYTVKSFRMREGDMTTTSQEGKRLDQNNEVCALIKIVTTETGFNFEAGALGIIETQQRVGEIWVWVPRASRKITLLHQKLGKLPDYRYPVEIMADRTYEMVLETEEVLPPSPQGPQQQYLAFQISPPNATLEVDGKFWAVEPDGSAQDYVRFGTYEWHVQAANYHPDAGRITVNDPDNTQVVTVTLKPNFGWIEVAGTGSLKDANVYVDNTLVGQAPCKSEALKSGPHTVRIVKKMYANYSETVTVTDNETTRLAPTLVADFAEVTLKVDADAEIWVNNERKGVRTWTGPLGSGTYKIECKLTNHETSTVSQEITAAMAGQTITLPAPKPIYGSLMVESSPGFAKLFVDGKEMGTTPKSINELLIGQHELRVTKEGYADYTATVTIAKGERKQVKATLSNGKEIQFTCNVPDAQLEIDGQRVGSATGTYQLTYGSHSLRATATDYREYTFTINVSETGSRSHSITMQSISRDEETFTVNGVSFTMKLVEGGTFRMGSNDSDAESDEKPVHKVTLSSYYIAETEVTQALWQAVMGSNPSRFKGDNLPVEQVSWNDCQEFIRKLNQKTGKNFRLPTEAEWEYAARGGKKSKGYKYAGSNTIDNVAWYSDNSDIKTRTVAVKSKSPNKLGLYDMTGNVMEWCSDWYGSYSSGSQTNPTGPSSGSIRVLRGGSWSHTAGYCRVSSRNHDAPVNGNPFSGFRLVLVQTDNGSKTVGSQGTSPTSSSSTSNVALPGVFSVSPTQKVHFAKGNLQYQASTNTWRFAENQWDYIGDANKGISSSYTGWIDLFGWGTGNNPTRNSQSDGDYSSFTDWGNKMGSGWRSLTKDEWVYVFDERSTSSGIRYAKASVNGVNGVILLPDNWSSSIYRLNDTNKSDAKFSSNTISSSTWNSAFAPAGVVFLPAAGSRYGISARYVGSYGYYWSASPYDDVNAYYVTIDDGSLRAAAYYFRYGGRSVRLARPAE